MICGMLRVTAVRTCFGTVFSVVSILMFALPSPLAAYVRIFHTPYIVTACDDKTTEQHIKER